MSMMDGLLNKFRINVADEDDEDFDDEAFDEEFDEEEARPKKSLFQHFKSSFDLDDDDDDDYEMPPQSKNPFAKEPKEVTQTEKPVSRSARSVEKEEPVETKKSKPLGGRVVPMSRVSGNANAMAKAMNELYMLKPKKEEDARDAVDALLSGKVVIVNLEGLNIEVAQYVTDFVTGANYSMGGNFSTINSQVLVFTPASIDLTGAFEENIYESRLREH